jgi:hypothetical protein
MTRWPPVTSRDCKVNNATLHNSKNKLTKLNGHGRDPTTIRVPNRIWMPYIGIGFHTEIKALILLRVA